jgi:hypothetical protein
MRSIVFVLALAGAATLAPSALAIQADSGGWYHTGDAVRQKTVFNVNVYSISHDMKCVVARSKQAVIDADCDKRFIWRMMRDVDKGKIIDAMREAFRDNSYGDQGKINAALAAFSADFKDGAYIKINYDSTNKATTFWEQNGGSATVAGADFMKATWSIWLGKIDPPSIGDRLIANL